MVGQIGDRSIRLFWGYRPAIRIKRIRHAEDKQSTEIFIQYADDV